MAHDRKLTVVRMPDDSLLFILNGTQHEAAQLRDALPEGQHILVLPPGIAVEVSDRTHRCPTPGERIGEINARFPKLHDAEAHDDDEFFAAPAEAATASEPEPEQVCSIPEKELLRWDDDGGNHEPDAPLDERANDVIDEAIESIDDYPAVDLGPIYAELHATTPRPWWHRIKSRWSK